MKAEDVAEKIGAVKCVDCSHTNREHDILVPRRSWPADEATHACSARGCKCESFTIESVIQAGPGFNIVVKL